jgi:hypothetical protein
VDDGAKECPRDGAPTASFERMQIVLRAGSSSYRVRRLPFEPTRAWVRTYFGDVLGPLAPSIDRYAPLGVFEEVTGGFALRGRGSAEEDCDHLRLDGAPLAPAATALRGAGHRLEVWSARRAAVVLTLEIALESLRP